MFWLLPHERLINITVVLAGLVKLTIRSPMNVCVTFKFLRSTSVIVPTPATCTVDVIVHTSQMVLGTSVLTKSNTPQPVGTGVGVLVLVSVLVAVRVRVLVGGVPVTVGVG